jgi:AraC-like DNA-binding protein
MSQDRILSFCITVYNSTFAPIHYFNKQELIKQIPENEQFLPLLESKIKLLSGSDKPVAYLETNEFNYIGIVKSRTCDKYIIIGPVLSGVCSKNALEDILIDAAISHQKLEEINDLFQLFPVMTFHQFLNILVLFNYELNGDYLSINQIIDIEDSRIKKEVENLEAEKTYQTKEEQSLHNTYQLERKITKYIEDGNPDAIRKYAESVSPIKSGVIAENNLRNTKNIFIVLITLATRSAIRGGLDIEVAYNLSDVYILQMERLSSIEAIYQLQFTMLIDFAKRVAGTKIPVGISSDIYECIQYISRNTNRNISVTDVAGHIGKNRSYVSQKFKNEMGFDLSAFIMRKKLEEAKSLLSFTDKSISEISYYLCFSSQSYFQNVFKKKFSLTPNEYRNGLSTRG